MLGLLVMLGLGEEVGVAAAAPPVLLGAAMVRVAGGVWVGVGAAVGEAEGEDGLEGVMPCDSVKGCVTMVLAWGAVE